MRPLQEMSRERMQAAELLYRGRVVWTQKTPGAYADGEKVSAYAEGVGIVTLDRASISPAG
jgi:hypothetical protein